MMTVNGISCDSLDSEEISATIFVSQRARYSHQKSNIWLASHRFPTFGLKMKTLFNVSVTIVLNTNTY